MSGFGTCARRSCAQISRTCRAGSGCSGARRWPHEGARLLEAIPDLDFRGLVDSKPAARRIEAGLIDGYVHDPDFVWRYPLDAILSLVSTPPPRPLGDLTIPMMFVVPTRGIVPVYFRALFARLPEIPKRLVEVDGSVFDVCSVVAT